MLRSQLWVHSSGSLCVRFCNTENGGSCAALPSIKSSTPQVSKFIPVFWWWHSTFFCAVMKSLKSSKTIECNKMKWKNKLFNLHHLKLCTSIQIILFMPVWKFYFWSPPNTCNHLDKHTFRYKRLHNMTTSLSSTMIAGKKEKHP